MRNVFLCLLACAAWTRAAVPLVFEENIGQADPAVRFIARGGGLTMLLAPE